ncbi:rod shape-determining protein MreC [bacterium A37T11]|nr:rod shape-determining protein MreC [bacterium A37T11]
MRNLWVFISKYNAFFLFILFFGFSILLVVRNNDYQRASAINSSSQVVGYFYQQFNSWTAYLRLRDVNNHLAEENASLRNQLKGSGYADSVQIGAIVDTTTKRRYEYYVAQVINNSIHQKNNYITINKGALQGIRKGMGVLSPTGVVGFVWNVSPHFATIQSLLHADTKVSATLQTSQAFGSLVWGEGNYNPRIAYLEDIPNHVKVKKGEEVFTSGYSVFPPGIRVGRVINTGSKGGKSFLEIQVALTTNFNSLQYVYVVKDDFANEKQQLEDKNNGG